VDPITAIAAATTAFNTVKKLVETGREIEDVAGQLGKWFSAVSDINQAERDTKNPPLFKKLLHTGSVEEEALNLTIARKKIIEQETKLREMIMFRYGIQTYKDMMTLRKQIREQRERDVYRQQKRRKQIIDAVIIFGSILLLIASIGFMVDLISDTLKVKAEL
jgi:hypothetical protein